MPPAPAVAPSRGRGSKQPRQPAQGLPPRSPPHGGADRNSYATDVDVTIGGRPLTGARIETSCARSGGGCARWSPPHGGADRNNIFTGINPHAAGRPLTGARIETSCARSGGGCARSPPHGGADRKRLHGDWQLLRVGSPPHGGADRNMITCEFRPLDTSRPLTGARIETCRASSGLHPSEVAPSRGRGSKTVSAMNFNGELLVAPSRGRGSKQLRDRRWHQRAWSPPHGGADRNIITRTCFTDQPGRPLTGARIETARRGCRSTRSLVAPSRGRGSKLHGYVAHRRGAVSPPHGGADRNAWIAGGDAAKAGRPLTGARIETSVKTITNDLPKSPPHGGADRNSRSHSGLASP